MAGVSKDRTGSEEKKAKVSSRPARRLCSALCVCACASTMCGKRLSLECSCHLKAVVFYKGRVSVLILNLGKGVQRVTPFFLLSFPHSLNKSAREFSVMNVGMSVSHPY